MKHSMYILMLIAVALVLAACGAAASPVPPTPTSPEVLPPASGSLTGSAWQLVSMGAPGAETPAVEGSKVTLEFRSDAELGGTGGCNGYGADYKAEGNTLAVGSVVSTMMACADERVMQQEQAYYEAIQQAGSFELSGDRLIIHYNNDQGVLTFARSAGVD